MKVQIKNKRKEIVFSIIKKMKRSSNIDIISQFLLTIFPKKIQIAIKILKEKNQSKSSKQSIRVKISIYRHSINKNILNIFLFCLEWIDEFVEYLEREGLLKTTSYEMKTLLENSSFQDLIEFLKLEEGDDRIDQIAVVKTWNN